tara:strand:- start:3546 stop:3728 length:183 start_codon:yes stop_codon:yes gene_type:complete
VAKFPDLSGDGKVTQKDILMGKGIIKSPKGGTTDTNRRKKISEALAQRSVTPATKMVKYG